MAAEDGITSEEAVEGDIVRTMVEGEGEDAVDGITVAIIEEVVATAEVEVIVAVAAMGVVEGVIEVVVVTVAEVVIMAMAMVTVTIMAIMLHNPSSTMINMVLA